MECFLHYRGPIFRRGMGLTGTYRIHPACCEKDKVRPVTHCQTVSETVRSYGSSIQRDTFRTAVHETPAVMAQDQRIFPEGQHLSHDQGHAAITWPQDNGASALTTHQLQVERRERRRANQVDALATHQLEVKRRESRRANQVYALTTHQRQVERRESRTANQVDALTTHQLQVERRESRRANQADALTTHQLQLEWRESRRANQV